ncbi:hypothetical protein P8625_10890 [Tenacibaculum tangerinum]|uniref:Lipocalin-like domain-containing protein n=1 Tax=Tenacibaculum tangerinum TaxID=3038772 RepID=A0ABY8L3L2_9FLAO|nr:hypothetical protein [Tenacibaculum tangerinum]WGH74594.1 hypothetical protein P8625_10890 [Tenacibaculum tangerinum]
MKKIILLFITIFSFFSCTEDSTSIINSDNLLLGYWSKAQFKNEELTFTRLTSLPDEEYGVSFKEDGTFIERTSGWCGTPPLIFFNVKGTWKASDKTVIEVSTQSYLSSFNWQIQLLTDEKLVVKRVLSEQEKDHRKLLDLFIEIQNLVYGVSCTDSSNWTFTAYGSNTCGGPKGYIAYSTEIDTENFLQKVAAYTEAERLYNIKWGIFSTCDTPSKPIGVACQNGYPVLKY